MSICRACAQTGWDSVQSVYHTGCLRYGADVYTGGCDTPRLTHAPLPYTSTDTPLRGRVREVAQQPPQGGLMREKVFPAQDGIEVADVASSETDRERTR
jgi:hypothetical protein